MAVPQLRPRLRAQPRDMLRAPRAHCGVERGAEQIRLLRQRGMGTVVSTKAGRAQQALRADNALELAPHRVQIRPRELERHEHVRAERRDARGVNGGAPALRARVRVCILGQLRDASQIASRDGG
jgi:hypothetical protein